MPELTETGASPMRTWLWIGLAGSAGALARYAVSYALANLATGPIPWGTLLANLAGCLLLGLAIGLISNRGFLPESWRAPVTVGFVGSFTTFSTWMVESLLLAQAGLWGAAAANITVSLAVGLPAVWAGLAISRMLPARAPARPAGLQRPEPTRLYPTESPTATDD